MDRKEISRQGEQERGDLDRLFNFSFEDTFDPKTQSLSRISAFDANCSIAEESVSTVVAKIKALGKIKPESSSASHQQINLEGLVALCSRDVFTAVKFSDPGYQGIVTLSVDPLNHRNALLDYLPNKTLFKRSWSGVTSIDSELFRSLFEKPVGKLLAVAPLTCGVPCLGDVLSFANTAATLSPIGSVVDFVPARLLKNNDGTTSVAFLAMGSRFFEACDKREKRVISDFETVLKSFADRIRNEPKLRCAYNQKPDQFQKEMLRLEQKLAIKFFESLFSDDNGPRGWLSRKPKSDDRVSEQVSIFAAALSQIKNQILEKNSSTQKAMPEFARQIASELGKHLYREAESAGYLGWHEISTSASVSPKVFTQAEKIEASNVRGMRVSFRETIPVLDGNSLPLTSLRPDYYILPSSGRLPNITELSGLTDAEFAKRSILWLGEPIHSFIPYQGIRINPALSKEICESEVFTLVQMQHVIKDSLSRWESNVYENSKCEDPQQALAERFKVLISTIEKVSLNVDTHKFAQSIADIYLRETGNEDALKDCIEKAKQLEERFLQQLYFEHLYESGIIAPLMFVGTRDKVCNYVPVGMGLASNEEMLLMLFDDPLEHDRQSKLLVSSFYQHFNSQVGILKPAAQALVAGLRFDEVFPKNCVAELCEQSINIADAVKVWGSEQVGIRMIAPMARRVLGVTDTLPTQNSPSVVESVRNALVTAVQYLNTSETLSPLVPVNDSLSGEKALDSLSSESFSRRLIGGENLDDIATQLSRLAPEIKRQLLETRRVLNDLTSLSEKVFKKRQAGFRVTQRTIADFSKEVRGVIAALDRSTEMLCEVTVSNDFKWLVGIAPEEVAFSSDTIKTVSHGAESLELSELLAEEDLLDTYREDFEELWESGLQFDFTKLEERGASISKHHLARFFASVKSVRQCAFAGISVEPRELTAPLIVDFGDVIELNLSRADELTAEALQQFEA